MADIDGIHFCCTIRQQHIGKPAGRAADIHRDGAVHLQLEMLDCVRELHAAARHPGMFLAAHRDFVIFGKFRACFIELLLTMIDEARHNQRLRLGARFREALGDKEKIEAKFCH